MYAQEFRLSFAIDGGNSVTALFRVFNGRPPTVIATELPEAENPGPGVRSVPEYVIAALQSKGLKEFQYVTHFNAASGSRDGGVCVIAEPSFSQVSWHMDGEKVVVTRRQHLLVGEVAQMIDLDPELVRQL